MGFLDHNYLFTIEHLTLRRYSIEFKRDIQSGGRDLVAAMEFQATVTVDWCQGRVGDAMLCGKPSVDAIFIYNLAVIILIICGDVAWYRK